MTTHNEIWNIDEDRGDLWESNSSRAALLAYLEVVALWHDQVEAGIYWGIPALHRLPQQKPRPSNVLEFEPSTQRSRPIRYTRDSSAGEFVVPVEIMQKWAAAA